MIGLIIVAILFFLQGILSYNFLPITLPILGIILMWSIIELHILFIKNYKEKHENDKLFSSFNFLYIFLILLIINLMGVFFTGNLLVISGLRGITLDLTDISPIGKELLLFINLDLITLICLRLIQLHKLTKHNNYGKTKSK